MSQRKKDLISLLEFSSEEIRSIITLALDIKKNRQSPAHRCMQGKTGVLIFEKPSLRTRITFETAIYELGGHPINLESSSVQMGKRESVEDVAHNLERWVHLIVARTFLNETIVQLARHSSISVINALSDTYHPCQALAFAMTLREQRPDEKDLHVVFVGDGNNVCSSLMIICAKLGYSFTLACPASYQVPPSLVNLCSEIARRHNATITITQDVAGAVSRASIIYTDVWTSMGQESEKEQRARIFTPYQVSSDLIAQAPGDVLVSHCLPAHRDEEITSEVLDSQRSIALDEAENRLHVQKAAIEYLTS